QASGAGQVGWYVRPGKWYNRFTHVCYACVLNCRGESHMIRKSWLGIVCGGLLLVTPLMARADAGGSNSPSSSRWDTPQEKPAGPAKVQAEYETGYRFLKAGDYKKAIKSFEKVLKENPSHALAYSNMGYSYRKLKQYDKALELYGKALMIDPKLAEA